MYIMTGPPRLATAAWKLKVGSWKLERISESKHNERKEEMKTSIHPQYVE